MLNPSYLLHATEPAEEIAEKLHQDILNKIIRRVMERVRRGDEYIFTATDRWQIQTLQEAGLLLEDIQVIIANSTPYMQREIAEAMEDAGVKALSYDDAIYKRAGMEPAPLVQSPNLVSIMQRDYLATLGDWKNFTGTTAEAAQQAYIRLCDRAYHQAMTGAVSPAEAVREALDELISTGMYVEFPSGRRDTIETATARAVRTGISQATGHIQMARMDEMGVDLILVSSHLGARPEHEIWQGQVYTKSGLNPQYPHFETVTGYGKVDGLCGANCRHSFGPYFEGQENPFQDFDDEENRKRYELEQRQRTLENRIRNTKRQVLNWKEAGDEVMYRRKAALLKKQNAAYNQFCEENNLKKRAERLRIAKWDRSEAAQAARAAAKK